MPISNIGFGQTRILNWAQTWKYIFCERIGSLYTNRAWFSDCKFDLCRISILIGRRPILRKCNIISSLFLLFSNALLSLQFGLKLRTMSPLYKSAASDPSFFRFQLVACYPFPASSMSAAVRIRVTSACSIFWRASYGLSTPTLWNEVILIVVIPRKNTLFEIF